MPGREFFQTQSVGQALAGFRPRRRTGPETVRREDALGRVPARAVRSGVPLPGFARSTVDGYAVRAADTYGAGDGLPAYLDVVGALRMGTAADVEVRSGGAVQIPTGAAVPGSADAVVMIEHTQVTMPGVIEVTRPVAVGDGVVRPDEDVAVGNELVPAGRPLRAQDLGLLAAAGITRLVVLRRPRVAIISTGDEVVAPDTECVSPGQVRDATASALAALVLQAGGEPASYGIVPDDLELLTKTLTTAVAECDLVVVSAGSSVGARDETTAAVEALGAPGVYCHGLAIKPGKPTLLAECADVPVIGLPGNPLSALVVFRMVGLPVLRLVGGITTVPPEPSTAATMARPVASAAGRLDVVQVSVRDGVATPLFGHSALLSLLTSADGYVVIPEPATGLDAGTSVTVTMYR
ncbi:molybdenum cofactor synthesis domain protein [Kribbella flavida DSM 17836]|uniref:Molybdopterin molybdenumtransferase n=1 Tax=Kribbella flavida (strain DSM 17836 / JCM 10339 / NBRC 14399) TaxID=479435 RepID=D2PS77_KRIFD|nr:gephyrin-like molybdotransferase Glp [Kribbella flavida]ADB31201.1 molybdenum cofactor synthesis domain protein [Kribbella flavida DSM 17836]